VALKRVSRLGEEQAREDVSPVLIDKHRWCVRQRAVSCRQRSLQPYSLQGFNLLLPVLGVLIQHVQVVFAQHQLMSHFELSYQFTSIPDSIQSFTGLLGSVRCAVGRRSAKSCKQTHAQPYCRDKDVTVACCSGTEK
jgi:hypothetical protein